ncbi:MAG: LysM domain-containing protein, partial [Chloroflexota bacterium]
PDLPGTPGGNVGSSQIYVVRPGDSLSLIAQSFGVSIYSLAAANHIFNYDLIYVDQRLVIPA